MAAEEYFLVSATVQDILNRHWLLHNTFDNLGDKIAIHLNDTPPVLAIPELMLLLIDEHKFDWSRAWEVVCQAFSYTNHTLMSEALEIWPVDMLGKILPRHLQIIFDINDHFLNQVQTQVPGDSELLSRVSIIDEHNGRMVRMAWLAVIASHKVNGVSELHSELIMQSLFADFARLFPDQFAIKPTALPHGAGQSASVGGAGCHHWPDLVHRPRAAGGIKRAYRFSGVYRATAAGQIKQ